MMSFKGIRKYLIYACIAGWMFFLGIVVGRGTSPVTFDTKEFSKKLEKIANIPDQKKGLDKKVDLKFYEDLDNSSTQERAASKYVPPANIPEKEPVKGPTKEPTKEPIKEPTKEITKEQVKESVKEPVKIVKKESVKKPFKGIKKDLVKEPLKETQKEPAKELGKPSVKEPEKEVDSESGEIKTEGKKQKPDEGLTETISSKGSYTIQIAAYKSFQEAVTKMAALEEKGFSSYRIKGEKDGVTLYRVKMGPFETYDAAKEFKARLDKAKVDSMIMKRENNEDIKE